MNTMEPFCGKKANLDTRLVFKSTPDEYSKNLPIGFSLKLLCT